MLSTTVQCATCSAKNVIVEHFYKMDYFCKTCNEKIYNPFRYIAFDTETTGTNKGARIIQLAWVIYDADGKILKEHNYLIKPVGFEIPKSAISIHKITTERALAEGENIKYVLELFLKDIENNAPVRLIAHNFDFDADKIDHELARINSRKRLSNFLSFCTMKETINICKIPSKHYKNYKYPRLIELHTHIFGYKFKNAHDALVDAKITAKCFFKLKENGELSHNIENNVIKTPSEMEKKNLSRDSSPNIFPLHNEKPLTETGGWPISVRVNVTEYSSNKVVLPPTLPRNLDKNVSSSDAKFLSENIKNQSSTISTNHSGCLSLSVVIILFVGICVFISSLLEGGNLSVRNENQIEGKQKQIASQHFQEGQGQFHEKQRQMEEQRVQEQQQRIVEIQSFEEQSVQISEPLTTSPKPVQIQLPVVEEVVASAPAQRPRIEKTATPVPAQRLRFEGEMTPAQIQQIDEQIRRREYQYLLEKQKNKEIEEGVPSLNRNQEYQGNENLDFLF